MRKILSIAPFLLVAALSLSVLVACGDDAANSPDVSDSSSSVGDSDGSDSSSSAENSDTPDSSSSAKEELSSSSKDNGGSGGSGGATIGSHAAMPSNQNPDQVRQRYNEWMAAYYVDGASDPEVEGMEAFLATDPSDKARIEWTDQPGYTVSEGMGYGMLFTALMGDFDKFDKLWRYQQAWRIPETGLMRWKIRNYMGPDDMVGPATDADIDVLAALLIAYEKSKKQEYLDDALFVAGSIYDLELSSGKLFLPAYTRDNSDMDDGHLYNISYMSVAAMKMLASYDRDHDWNAVLSANLTYMKQVQDAGDGLWPDWSNQAGAPIDPENNSAKELSGKNGKTWSYAAFQKEAVRIPWRMAWYYAWYGDSEAKAMLNKANVFLEGVKKADVTPDAAYRNWYGYDDGNFASGIAGVHMWASYCATAMGGDNQAWLDSCNATLLEQDIPVKGYYPASLQLMYLMLFNGIFSL
jgi:endo-1,4-beta-D-glucanase Y